MQIDSASHAGVDCHGGLVRSQITYKRPHPTRGTHPQQQMKFATVLALATALSAAQAFWIPSNPKPEEPSPFKPSFPTVPAGFHHYPNTTFVKPGPPSPTTTSSTTLKPTWGPGPGPHTTTLTHGGKDKDKHKSKDKNKDKHTKTHKTKEATTTTNIVEEAESEVGEAVAEVVDSFETAVDDVAESVETAIDDLLEDFGF